MKKKRFVAFPVQDLKFVIELVKLKIFGKSGNTNPGQVLIKQLGENAAKLENPEQTFALQTWSTLTSDSQMGSIKETPKAEKQLPDMFG